MKPHKKLVLPVLLNIFLLSIKKYGILLIFCLLKNYGILLTFSVHFEAAHSLFGTPDHGVPISGIGVEGVQAVSALQPIVPSPVGG